MVVRLLAAVLIWAVLGLNIRALSIRTDKTGSPQRKYVCLQQNPGSEKEQQAYIKLIRATVAPANQAALESYIKKLKKTAGGGDDATLFSIADFADQKNSTFLIGLDWKAGLDDLEWRLSNALKQNFSAKIAYPSRKLWSADASVSTDHVFPIYDKALRKQGFQLGFIETKSDDYILLVFKTSQENVIKNALKEIGYVYYDASKF